MKMSKRGEYAMRALIDLGIAHACGRDIVKIGEIAEKELLPIKFLEQILNQLREAGYIQSKRGKQGGYTLALPPERIKIGDVVRLIDGPLAPIRCVSVTAYERCSCPDEEHCGLRALMLEVRNSIADILDQHTLAQMIEHTMQTLRRDKIEPSFAAAQNPKLPARNQKKPAPKSKVEAREKGLEKKLKPGITTAPR